MEATSIRISSGTDVGHACMADVRQTAICAFARYVFGDTGKLDSSFDWHKSAWPMMSPTSKRHQHRGRRIGAAAAGLVLVTPALAMRNMEGSVLVSEKVGRAAGPGRIEYLRQGAPLRGAKSCQNKDRYRRCAVCPVFGLFEQQTAAELTKYPEFFPGADNARGHLGSQLQRTIEGMATEI